jgi:ABC-2 type transport system permease protein
MNPALFYLYSRTLANSLRQRVLRLRRPKYAFGAIFAGLYFYFYFYRLLFLRNTTHGAYSAQGPAALSENLAALILFAAVLVFAWVLPAKRTALMFSEAEIALLFPAPLTRQSLIRYKLLTRQIGIFIFALLMTLVTGRGNTGQGWLRLAGFWVIISTFSLHRLAASFALTRLMERGMANWQRRMALVLGFAALGGVLWAWHEMAPAAPGSELLSDRGALSEYLESILASGPGPWLLLPFRVVIRPYFAPDSMTFARALAPALCLLILHYWWVMRADVSFEDASIALAQKRAAYLAAREKGEFRLSLAPRRSGNAVFRLRPGGPPSVAFFWKALLYSGGWRTLRIWLICLACAVLISAGWMLAHPTKGFAVGLCVAGVSMFVLVLIVNVTSGATYLRQDLTAMDLLQTYPIRGWQALLGQLGAQAAMGAVVQWAALLLVALGVLGLPRLMDAGGHVAMAALTAAAIIAVPFNLTMMIVPAGTLLLWPGWFRSGPQSAGFETGGLRLILLAGQLFAMVLALIPPALAGGIVWSTGRYLEWGIAWLPGAAIVSSAVLALEAWVGIMMLGALFERFDVSAD